MIIAKDDKEKPTEEELNLLIGMVYTSTLDYEETIEQIMNCTDYNNYQRLQFRLEDNQKGYDDVVNPNMGDIRRRIKQITGRKP